MSTELSDSRYPSPTVALTADPSGSSESTGHDDPGLEIGWTSAAIAIRSILQLDFPMFLRLQLDAHTPILIDFRHRAFTWGTPLAQFPVAPGCVTVETEATSNDAPPLFELPAQDVDGLLWLVGTTAFDGQPATWLLPHERYRLRRWPNILGVGISADQVRMTALLGSGFFTARELALASGTDVLSAYRLINAYTLMNIAYSSDEAPAAPPRRPEPRAGLFRRLRDRLGL